MVLGVGNYTAGALLPWESVLCMKDMLLGC
jgi:hypothetical protein